jgi:hypothetical protein
MQASLFTKKESIDCNEAFHFFGYRRFETAITDVGDMLTTFLQSAWFTYSTHHPAHCCGPFDNTQLQAHHFLTLPAEDMYKDLNRFFKLDYFDCLDHIRNEDDENTRQQRIATDKTNILKLIEKAGGIIKENLITTADSILYTVGCIKDEGRKNMAFRRKRVAATCYMYRRTCLSITKFTCIRSQGN